MPLILSIETATGSCSVALHKTDRLIAHMALLLERSHAESLMGMITQILQISKYDRHALDAIAISSGPGSYTGLRIGTAVGKGLCYGLNVPLIAISTLASMAHGISPFIDKQYLLCPTIDARRNAVYTLIADQEGHIQRATHVAHLDDETYQNELPTQPLLFFGNGTLKCKYFLAKYKHIHFIEDIMPSAIQIGDLAYAKFQQQIWEEIVYYEPLYMSQF